MFKILLSEEAVRELRKLDNETAKRILEKINEAGENPQHYFKRLSGRDEYKLRVGDYRVIANITQNDRTIFIRSLGHRKSIYEER